MPRLPVALREAEKISTPLPGGRCCARVNDVPPSSSWEVCVSLSFSLVEYRMKDEYAYT